MPFYQLHNGEDVKVTGTKVSGKLTYVAYHYALYADVYEAAAANTPTGYAGASRVGINPKLLGGGVWLVEIDIDTPTDAKPALDENTTPPTPPPPPPAADPSSVPPIADPQPAPLPPLEGQLGGPAGDGSFNPPGGGAGGDGTGGGLAPTPGRDEPLGAEWSFDTTGGTTKVLQSIFTPYGRAAGLENLAPDLKGAIGSTEDGVEGVDVVTPRLRVTHTRTVRKITGGYVDAMSALTGSVNNAPFLWWAEGEVLFVGMSGPFKAPAGWTLSWEFWVQKNQKDVVIIQPSTAPGATFNELAGLILPYVEGWQYVDVSYEAAVKEDGDGKKKARRVPTYAYVHQVYHKKDFSAIGIQ